jgi:ESCRT-I complex subunit TSG101
MVGQTGTPTTHASTQFLNSVLSQRGPQALPYVEDDKYNIRQHLLNVSQEFPGLQVGMLQIL